MFYPAAAFMMPVGARSMDIDRADCLLAALMDPYGVTTAVTDRVLFAPGTDVKAKHYSGPESSRLTEIESAAQQTPRAGVARGRLAACGSPPTCIHATEQCSPWSNIKHDPCLRTSCGRIFPATFSDLVLVIYGLMSRKRDLDVILPVKSDGRPLSQMRYAGRPFAFWQLNHHTYARRSGRGYQCSRPTRCRRCRSGRSRVLRQPWTRRPLRVPPLSCCRRPRGGRPPLRRWRPGLRWAPGLSHPPHR